MKGEKEPSNEMKILQASYFLVLIMLLISFAACNNPPTPPSRSAVYETDSIHAPVIKRAGTPEIKLLSDHPPPEVTDLSQNKLPEKRPAGFFITMQNFNTDQGLALSSILSGFKDSAGNLWFGTFGNGVSKYDGQSFTNYNSSHGLIHNLIEAITEDREGNIWFSTYGGASKYNGVSFENYTTKHGLPDNHINRIIEDHRGNIWLATRGGLSRYNPDRNNAGANQFVNYKGNQGFTVDNTTYVIEDRIGNIWVSGQQGVFKLNPVAGENGEVMFSNFSEITGLENEFVNCMVEDRDGLLWLGTSKGAVRFDPAKVEADKTSITTFTKADGLISNSITSILEDSAGNIWLGSEEGVSEFIKEDGTIINYTSQQGLASSVVVCMVEDNAGSIWFGTKGNGLSRFDGSSTIEYTAREGLPGNNIFSVTEDQKGDIWIGAEKSGLTKFTQGRQEKNQSVFVNYSTAQGLREGSVMNMMADKAGNLWFGSGYGLSKYNGKTVTTWSTTQGLITKSVVSLKEDSKGNIWFGTYEGGLSMFDGKSFSNYTTEQGLVHNTVWNIHEETDGTIWLATRGGLSRFDGKRFINFTTEQGLPDNKLSIVTQDRFGNLLIGSWGSGVSIIRKSKFDELVANDFAHADEDLFENFNSANGLANDIVYGILEDKHGNLLIGTSKGLTVLNGGLDNEGKKIARNGIEYYNQKSGYPINDVSNNYSMHLDSRGFVWIGTGDKLVRFDYGKVRKSTKAPNVVIKNININSENISWQSLKNAQSGKKKHADTSGNVPAFINDELQVFGRTLSNSERDTMIFKFNSIRFDDIRPFSSIPENLVLPFSFNTITFDFVAIETKRPFLIQYQYMLDGFEKQWSALSDKSTAEYRNLPHGKYTFNLKAKSPGGIWSEPIAYSFQIMPPWWLTWWAFLTYVSAFGLMLFGIRRYEMNRILLRNELKLEKVTSDSLRNLDQLKSQFYANISHEFRTPLTLILGQIESVMSSKIDNKEKGKLQVANRNARRLLKLINELLDLSKLEAGSMELKATTQNIVSFLKSLFFSFESLAATKNIDLEFETTTDQILVLFDPDKMEKVFYNLMSNAFKFTPEKGAIKVTIDIANDGFVEVCVKDTGCGIPKAKTENIFDRFYQVDDSNTREHEGTGIGLALAKELVLLHKGTISVNSNLGKGSEFTISLPYEGLTQIESTVSDKQAHESKPDQLVEGFDEIVPVEPVVIENQQLDGDKKIILIVEDNNDVRAYIREQVEDEYHALEAIQGDQGLTMAQDTVPDLIITDVMMPKMDGYQFCNAIRLDEKTSHIPIIMLTAKGSLDDKIEGLEAGVDAYLTKPFSARELKATVKNLLHQRIQLRKRFSNSTVINPLEVSTVSADKSFLERILHTIESNFADDQFSVEALAESSGMSKTQLNRKLNALIDQPPGQMIRSFRLQKAAELLEKTSGTVSEICYAVGFSDNAYFSRAFKKQFDCSPSEYQDQTKEN